jgi:hypothetical protein
MQGQTSENIMAISSPFDSTQIREEQQKDWRTEQIYDQLLNGKHRQSYILENNVLHKTIHRPGGVALKVPYKLKSMINSLLQAYHDSPTPDRRTDSCARTLARKNTLMSIDTTKIVF